jgi:hypothetical protein
MMTSDKARPVSLPLKPAATAQPAVPPSKPAGKPAAPPAPRPCSHKHNSSNAKELKKLMGHDCGKKDSAAAAAAPPPAPRKSKSLSAVPNKVRRKPYGLGMHRISGRPDNPAFFYIRPDTRLPCLIFGRISGKAGYRISGLCLILFSFSSN